MDAPPVSFAESYLQQVASFLEPREVPRWLARHGLDPTALLHEHLELSAATFSAMLVDARVQAGEPALGVFLGQHLASGAHGLVGYAAVHSSTPRELVDLVATFLPLRMSHIRVRQWHDDNGHCVAFELDFAAGAATRTLLETAVLSLRRLLDEVSLGQVSVRSMVFPFAEPPYAAIVRDVAGVPVEYGRDWAGLVLPVAELERPLKLSNSRAFEEASRICRTRLAAIGETTTTTARVRRLLLSNETGIPSHQAVAHRLRMSPRTLRRRLAAESTTFRRVVDDVRFELAKDHLAQPHTSLDELAYLLGYTDTANFRRAFRRWAGVSPTAYRARETTDGSR